MTIKIYIANNSKDVNRHQELKTYLINRYGGYTLYNATGGYKSDNMMVYSEESLIYELMVTGEQEQEQEQLQEQVKRIFTGSKEESILISCVKCNYNFITL